MSLFKYFKRKGEEVSIDVDSTLNVPKFVYPFSFCCSNENYAELLKEKLNMLLLEYKKEIARDVLLYLSNEEKSQMKSSLKNWDGRKHCWKG